MSFLRFIYFTVIFCTINFAVLSQNYGTIDSLQNIIKNDKSDTAKVNHYINLSLAIDENKNFDNEIYAQKALYLSEQLQIDSLIAKACFNKGRIFRRNNKNKKAIQYWKRALMRYEKIENLSAQANIYYHLGILYKDIGKYELSLQSHMYSFNLYEKLNNSKAIINSVLGVARMYWDMGKLDSAKVYYLQAKLFCNKYNDTINTGAIANSLGTIYQKQGDYVAAINSYKEAKEIRIKTNHLKSVSLITTNIGGIYSIWGQPKMAMKKYRNALKIAKQENYKFGMGYAYVNIGKIYSQRNKFTIARKYMDSALVMYKELNMSDGVSMCYRNIGDNFMDKNKIDSAIKYYKKSIGISKEINANNHLASGYLAIGKAYLLQKKLALSKKNIELALETAKNKGYTNICREIYLELTKILEQMHKYKQALYYYKEYTKYDKKIFNEKNNNAVRNLRNDNIRIKEEKQKALEEQEKIRIQAKSNMFKIYIQYLIITIIIIAIFLVIIAFLYVKSARRKNQLIESEAFLTKKNEEINKQKNILTEKEKALKESNTLLYNKTDALQKNKTELQSTIKELQKATEYRNKIFSIIGHDLKAPMGTINNILTLIMDGNIDSNKSKLMLSHTQKSAVSAHSLLENLLVWANNEQGKIEYKPKTHILNNIVKENINLLNDIATEKSISFKINLEDNLKMYADYNMVSTIIRNLIANAIKFSNNNDKIIISAKRKENFIEISVKDNGVGISKENLKKILNTDFHYSSKGTEGEPGSGLGLQLCFEFIKINKGDYQIISKEGEGSNFIVNLPAFEKQA